MARTGALYTIEGDIRGSGTPTRQAARQARAKPILDAMKPWLEAKLAAVLTSGMTRDAKQPENTAYTMRQSRPLRIDITPRQTCASPPSTKNSAPAT